MKKFNINSGKLLTVAVAAVGLIGTILSSKQDSVNREQMKNELRDELLSELSKEK